MLKQVVAESGGRRVVIMDSITKVTPDDEGAFVVAASHGGASSGEFALEIPLGLVVLNDAGIGKDEAGIASLAMLEARGVPCATVGHDTARIGDAADMWESGIVSRVNQPAARLGLEPGQPLKATLEALLRA
ncbi:hypothetical protein [Lichenicoccus roseus]|uniref:Uncharacterized protein n=1 Tax=Lichenicoccus roseus TaxID=2683649 RepID=A0A5R9J6V4_9PROT|nr:hypothetical protein [Lichenicoccus roseus]TLU71351.1 hypothetical protein FE263_17820 [Lichenicoccus roseus]